MISSILTTALPFILLLAALAAGDVLIRKNRPKTEGKEKTRAPELPGAWPFIGHLHLLGAKVPIVRLLAAMADKHGPIFSLRLGNRPALVVNNWEMVKECYATNDRVFASRPSMAVAKYMGNNGAVFSLAAYGAYWREIRKMITLELLTNQQLEKLRHVRETELDNLVKKLFLLSKNKMIINMNNWLEYLTFNMILRTLAGKRFSNCNEEYEDKEERKIKEGIKKALYYSGIIVVSDVIPWLEWLDIGGHIKGMKKAGKELDVVLQSWLDEHIETREKKKEDDIMDVMLSAFPHQNQHIYGHKRDDVIKSTATNLILTASESTAETIIWAVSLLLNHPDILKLAQDELDSKVGKSKWIRESDLNNLPYLQAIVKETLRLYPPGPLSGPREATEDCYVGDYFVPKGTRLIVNLWKLHRDPRIWKDPSEFKPERFIDDCQHNYKGQNYEYIPFSAGRRMCPAVNYGLLVVHLTLARLIHSFDISTPPMAMGVDMSEGLGIALPKLEPLQVVLNPRLSLDLYHNCQII